MGQKMRDAPIYYAIVQVRFNTVLQIERHVPEIQDELRLIGFPDYERAQIVQVIPPAPIDAVPTVQHQTRFDFMNADRTAGFLLEANSLSYHTTHYETVDPFVESFLNALRIVSSKVGGLSYTERVGMRTLDAIQPATDETLGDYLQPPFLGVGENFPDRDLMHSFSETRTRKDNTYLLSRAIVLRQEHAGQPAFPPELSPVSLKQASKFAQIDGSYAIVDTDCWREGRDAFSFEGLTKQIGYLHSELRRSFVATVTQKALKKWT